MHPKHARKWLAILTAPFWAITLTIMKTAAHLLCAIVFAFPSLMATPDRNTTISESFLGSDSANFAVLRTERDNLGSYYKARTKVWLVEHPKVPSADNKPRKTLLLDQTTHVDPDTMKSHPPEEHFKDGSTALADIIVRFPVRQLDPWTPDQIAALRFDQSTGRTEFKTQCLWEGVRHAEAAEGESRSAEFTLVGVAEDGNCIFLNIALGGDENTETTWVCIPASVTRNVHALRGLEPIYLSAGSYPSAKEALARCKEVGKTMMGFHGRTLQVWSVFHDDTGKTDYAVVLEDTTDFLRGDPLGTKQQHPAEIRWLPLDSEGFRELVVEPAP
jgi:hypothetical protein